MTVGELMDRLAKADKGDKVTIGYRGETNDLPKDAVGLAWWADEVTYGENFRGEVFISGELGFDGPEPEGKK